MTTGERIRALRLQNGLTMEELAQKIGLQKAAIYKYENGIVVNLKRDVVEKLAQVFGVSPSYIMCLEDELPADVVPYAPTHKIPILGRISAGLPLYAEEQVEGYTYTELNGGAEYFALRVTGDSMTAARINEGDLLIVRRQETVDNGQVAVVMVDGDEATVKRWHQDGDTITLMPQSYNPKHQPQVYDAKKTSVRVIGLVVKVEITL